MTQAQDIINDEIAGTPGRLDRLRIVRTELDAAANSTEVITGLQSQVGSLTNQLTFARVEIGEAAEEIAEKSTEISTLKGTNAALVAEVAALKTHDATHHPVTPPPVPLPPRGLLIGSNVRTIPGVTLPQEIVRCFEDHQFAAIVPGDGNGEIKLADHIGKRAIHYSVKDDAPTQGRIDAFLNSVPKAQMQGSLYLYVTNHHEQERGDKGFTPAQVRQTQKLTIVGIQDWMRRHPDCPNVAPTICNMGWYERDAVSAKTSTADYWPSDIDLSGVVLAIDPYDPTETREISFLCDPTDNLWAQRGGRRVILGEVNTKRTGDAAYQWWKRTFAWLKMSPYEAAQLFLHPSAGKDAPWEIDSAAARAFQEELAA